MPLREENTGVHGGGTRGSANLLFARPHMLRVRDMAPRVHEEINALDMAYAEIHRAHPFLPPPDVAAVLRTLLEQPRYRSILGSDMTNAMSRRSLLAFAGLLSHSSP